MHELSLVEGIIEGVQETAAANGGRVRSFKVAVGELAQFDLRIVRELLAEIKKGTPLADAKVRVEVERARVRCLSCDSVWSFDDIVGPLAGDEREVVHFLPELMSSYSRCPSCGKSFFEIEAGRSVKIAEVVLDD